MNRIVWISDFFINEVNGGAEVCDEAAMGHLSKKYNIIKIKTRDLLEDIINENKNCLWVISNFVQFQDYNLLQRIIENEIKFIHYSHDHLYCLYRNPYKHNSEMNCDCYPHDGPLHGFLNNATAILCQTKWHKEMWDKNVENPRILTIGSNLWSLEILDYIEHKLNENVLKNNKYVIFSSPYEHKNTAGAIEFANKNKLEYELIRDLNQKNFIDKLIESKGIIFLPLLAESCSRILIEARMCNCSIKTNNLSGCTKEEWFQNLKGKELIHFFRDEQPKKFIDIINVIYDNVV